jgi:hypothetical protein
MLELFFEGGWLFMSLVTMMALAILFFAAKGVSALLGNDTNFQQGSLYYIRFFGMLALVIGIFGQLIGLYEALVAISIAGDVTQEMLAVGIRVSSITTLYGFLVFIIAHLIWFALDIKWRNSAVNS